MQPVSHRSNLTSSARATPQLEVEIAGLLKSLRDTFKAITDPSALETQLRTAFGVPILSDTCRSARYGSIRPADDIIAVEKAARIAARDPKCAPLESLEIAGGRSLGGRNSDFGCPFPARAESIAWAGKIRVTLTDFNVPWGCTLLFRKDGALHIEHLSEFSIVDDRLFSSVHYGPERRIVEPLSLLTVRQRCGPESSIQIEKIRQHLWILCDHRWEGAEPTWVLPHLSDRYERAYYDIPETRRDVDFFRLEESFPGKRFDFIIGRHIHNMRDEDVARLRAQVAAKLNPDGWAYISVGGWRRQDHVIEIGTRISDPELAREFSIE